MEGLRSLTKIYLTDSTSTAGINKIRGGETTGTGVQIRTLVGYGVEHLQLMDTALECGKNKMSTVIGPTWPYVICVAGQWTGFLRGKIVYNDLGAPPILAVNAKMLGSVGFHAGSVHSRLILVGI